MGLDLTKELRTLLLAGVGALATSVDKSRELLDDLVKKGELTVEQGRVLNEELKHTVERVNADKPADDKPAAEPAVQPDTGIDTDGLTAAQKRALLEKLTAELNAGKSDE